MKFLDSLKTDYIIIIIMIIRILIMIIIMIIIIIIIIMGRFSGSALHRPPPADGRRARAHRRVACSRPAPYCQPERYTFPSSCLAAWLPGCLSVHVYMYDVWYTVYDVRNVHTHTHTHLMNTHRYTH